MPADDLTDPAPATSFSHLDATTVLSRQIAEIGIYPAVDPLDSTIKGFDAICKGEYDHLPEAAFYMVGGIEEVVEKAEKMSEDNK